MNIPVLLPPLPALPLPAPDDDAQRVLQHAASGENLVVLGGPGSGKTTLALHLLQAGVAAGQEVLLLSPTRSRAGNLRQRATTECNISSDAPGTFRVQTPASYALSVLTTSFAHRADPLPAPVLLAGAEEDAALAELVQQVSWPDLPPEAVRSRGFRNELRNLLARAGELGVDGVTLAQMGQRYAVPIWRSAAGLLTLWDQQGKANTAQRGQARKLDTARLQDRACESLQNWEAEGVTVCAPLPDLVIVDDYQDCTAATARLLLQLSAGRESGEHTQVIVLGDPDLAVETFRGGRPSLLVEAEDHSGLSATRLTLHQVYRGGSAIFPVVSQQISRIPVAGTASHRERQLSPTGTETAPCAGSVKTLIASSPMQEIAHVAHALRTAHIHQGVPWDQMAVISRSAGHAQRIAHGLRRRGVPVAASPTAVLLRAEPAAAAVLNIVQTVLTQYRSQNDAEVESSATVGIDMRAVRALLLGPLVGLSQMDLRRLRRQARSSSLVSAEQEPLTELVNKAELAEKFANEQVEKPLFPQAKQLLLASRIVAAVRKAVKENEDLETLLWAAWDTSQQAEQWRETALTESADGFLAEVSEHNLDVLSVLFKRAEVWAQRHPGQPPTDFLDEINAEVLPSDSVAPHGIRPAGIQVLTPAAAMGQEWEIVAVTGVNRDQWPDLRQRDSLTRTDLLVDIVTGRLGEEMSLSAATSSRVQVQADERRMFVAALSRATRDLVITACNDEDNAPSNFFYEVAKTCGNQVLDEEAAPIVAADTNDLTLRALVGQLRLAATQGRLPQANEQVQQRGRQAEKLLAYLAQQNCPGAAPQEWNGLVHDSSAQPLVDAGVRIRLSPSDIETVTDCPLRWFMQRHGGAAGSSTAQTLGTLIHELAEQAESRHLRGAALMAEFESRLPELGYPATFYGGKAEAKARNMVERLDAYFKGVVCPADVEKKISTDLDLVHPQTGQTVPVTIVGRIDRLEFPQGREHQRVRIVDFKTGKTKTNLEGKQNLQLRAYRRVLETEGFEVLGGALVFLNTDTKNGQPAIRPKDMVLMAEDQPEASEDAAAEDIDAIIAKAALATLGPSYPGCGKAHCPYCQLVDTYPLDADGK